MSDIINSATKFRPTEQMLREMTVRALNCDFTDFFCKELAGGLCNAVYLVQTEKGKLVLKVASPKDVIVMRHERDYVANEAKMLKLFGEKLDIPAPKLIYFDDSETVCPVPYFFMSFIDGVPMNNVNPYPSEQEFNAVKFRVGEICREISSLKAEKFGIPAMPETYTDSNYEFMYTLFKLLFLDISDKNMTVPEVQEQEIMSMLEKCAAPLDEVKQPVHIHTDTWDGNLMIKGGRLEGIIDYAAVLYGDPLMNHDFHDFSPVPNRHFCRGFGKETFAAEEELRMAVYCIWHRLGIIAEVGFRNYDDPNMYSWVFDEYKKSVNKLRDMLG
ncbi:MAG: aminoglycoside phosphotransferase family protein [Eubacterium sp.]|nr:aminoglycoside phosphotransferase family protein [Eubacterium sp.]